MHMLEAFIMQESQDFLRAKKLAAKLDCGVSTIWAMVKDGRLPQPHIRLGARCTLWSWQEVQAWIAEQADARTL